MRQTHKAEKDWLLALVADNARVARVVGSPVDLVASRRVAVGVGRHGRK